MNLSTLEALIPDNGIVDEFPDKENTIKHKLLFPCLALALSISACNLQAPPTSTSVPSVAVTDTLLPPAPSPTTPSLPSTPTIAGLSLAGLQNGTYHTPAFGKTFTLVNGSFSSTTATGTYTAEMVKIYALGDLNGDGVEDAAIILAENDGGTGVFETVIAVFDEGGSPVQASELLLGDRVQIDSMNISSNVIHLGVHVQGPNDPMCCPSLAQKSILLGHKRQAVADAGDFNDWW